MTVSPSADTDYRGPDRRVPPRPTQRATWLAAVAVLLAPVVGYATTPSHPQTVTVAATIALTLAIVVGLLAGVSTRTLGDHRIKTFSLGLLTLTIGPLCLAGFLAHVSSESPVRAALLAALPAFVLLGIAPFGPPIDTRHRPLLRASSVAAAAVFVVAVLALPWLRELIDGPSNDGVRLFDPALLALAGLGVLSTLSYGIRGVRTSSDVLLGCGLVPLAGAVAAFVTVADGARAQYVAWFTVSVGLLGALHSLVRALLSAHRHERRRVLAALSRAEVLRTNQEQAKISRAQVHELRSGLLMLEGAMQRLAEQRGTDTELEGAIAAELARLRLLLDPNSSAAPDDHYVLADALSPVLTCARASGMTLHSRLDADAVVAGDPFVTAQVLQGLLANADRHAHGSPVEVACERDGTEVVVRVADYGPGLVGAVRDRVFEEGVHDAAGGDGLGLSIASRLVASQRGRIRVLERGDGLTFELRLPATATV